MKRPLGILTLLLLSVAHMEALSEVGRSASSITPSLVTEERGIVALDQVFRELANPYTVMCVAAHSDDVDWGTLAYYHRRLGTRAVVVLATTIEGGTGKATQGFENPGATDIQRTLETARAVGADVYLLNLRQPDASMSADELIKLWGHDEALGMVVRAFRLLRPDVVVTNHSPKDDRAHLALWRLVSEAFEAAADASRFSDDTSRAWQVRRVFQKTDEASAEVTVNPDEFDQIRGMSYSQIAELARQARTGAASNTQPVRIFYRLARSATGERMNPGSSLLDDLSLPENLARSLALPANTSRPMAETINQREALVDALIEKLIEKHTEGSADTLFERYGAEFFRVLRFRETLEKAIALALGLDFRVSASDSVVVPGQKFGARLVLKNGSNRALPVVFHRPEALPDIGKTSPSVAAEVVTLARGGVVSLDLQYDVRSDTQTTTPHTSARTLEQRNYYPLGSALPGSHSTNPFNHELVAYADVGLGQISIMLPARVSYDVAPPVEIRINPSAALIRDWTTPRRMEFMASIRNRTPGPLAGALWVVPAAIANVDYEPAHLEFTREDELIRVTLELKLPILKPPLAPDILLEFRREKPAPPDPLASTKITVAQGDFEVGSGLSVGFIRSQGMHSDPGLSQLGVAATEIFVDSLRVHETGGANPSRSVCSDLSHFDSLIVDSLYYFADADLISPRACLLEYVRKGGNLIVLGLQRDDLAGPGPASVALDPPHHQVRPAISVAAKDHPVLLNPNRVSETDFGGWPLDVVFDRSEWPGETIPLIELSRPGQSAKRPVLLFGRFGEGTYIYCGLNLAEQIFAGNQTAHRLMANMVGASKSRKQRWYDEW